MKMIKCIDIKNFKSLLDATFYFGKFNILSGTNSSGKTSLIHSLLFLTQNYHASKIAHFNGELVQLGEFIDIKNFNSSITEQISFKGIIDGNEFNLTIAENELDKKVSNIKISESINLFEYEKSIYYISANRIGIKDVHDSGNDNEHYGINGEYTVDYLVRNRDSVLPEDYIFDKKKEQPNNLFNEVDFWLFKITGSHIKGDEIENTNKSIVTFSHKNGDRFVRSINTGSGISYVLSILILCLGVASSVNLEEKMPTIIIENPEIHLHPRAQSILTEFLIFVSQKIQLIIETQSDHVFNRFRIEVYNRQLSSEKVINELGSVHYLEYLSNSSSPHLIQFTNDGRVKNHQIGLFDQFDVDVMKLLGVKDNGKSSS